MPPVNNQIARGASIQNMLGAVRIRRHDQMPENKELLGKIPREFGENEKNVAWGLGKKSDAAAGTAQYTVQADKDLILRDMHIECGPVRARVSKLTIGGDPALLGDTYPTSAWDFRSVNPPTFDYYLKGGCPVKLDVILDAAYTLDVGFSID